MKSPKEPKWLAEVAPDSSLTSYDVHAMFGYASIATLSTAVSENRFPPPDYKRCGKSMWKVATIRKEFRRRARLIAQHAKSIVMLAVNPEPGTIHG